MPDNCFICKYNTNSPVCHPNCSGCDGHSKYERGNFKMKSLNELTKVIHENAVAHGWWDEERGFPEVIALIHSELSEALEEYRDAKPPVYFAIETLQRDGTIIPEVRTDYGDGNYTGEKPEGIAIELADAIIRILDYCGYAGIDIEEAIALKHEYNKTRPYRHGGKKC